MTTLYRVRAKWAGFTGGPGISTFYFVNAPHLAAVKGFFNDAKANLPTAVTVSFPNAQDTIEDTTGALNGTWTDTAQTSVTGTGTGSYIAAGGYALVWFANAIIHKRHVRGHTYLVPGAGATTNGVPTSTELTTLQTAGSNFLTAAGGDFVIYSRPFAGTPSNPARAGSNHAVTAGAALEKFVVLRSRRD